MFADPKRRAGRPPDSRRDTGATRNKMGGFSAALLSFPNFLLFLRPGGTFSSLGDAWASRLRFQDLLYAVVLRGELDGRKFLAFDDHFDLVGVEHFALQQSVGDSGEHVSAVGEQRLRSAVALVDQAPHFQVDFDRGVFAVVAMLRNLAAQEDL